MVPLRSESASGAGRRDFPPPIVAERESGTRTGPTATSERPGRSRAPGGSPGQLLTIASTEAFAPSLTARGPPKM
jgi:hypothetical protein